jgi:hypothetical protein
VPCPVTIVARFAPIRNRLDLRLPMSGKNVEEFEDRKTKISYAETEV